MKTLTEYITEQKRLGELTFYQYFNWFDNWCSDSKVIQQISKKSKISPEMVQFGLYTLNNQLGWIGDHHRKTPFFEYLKAWLVDTYNEEGFVRLCTENWEGPGSYTYAELRDIFKKLGEAIFVELKKEI